MSEPSISEIAALTARLRALSEAGAAAEPAQRAVFLADKDRLLDRITAAADRADPPQRGRGGRRSTRSADVLAAGVRTRAGEGGYVLVGPSARTWHTDPVRGRPLVPAPEAEHQAVRELLQREELATTPAAWTDGPSGPDVVSGVILADDPADTEVADPWAERGGIEACRRLPPEDAPEASTRGVVEEEEATTAELVERAHDAVTALDPPEGHVVLICGPEPFHRAVEDGDVGTAGRFWEADNASTDVSTDVDGDATGDVAVRE